MSNVWPLQPRDPDWVPKLQQEVRMRTIAMSQEVAQHTIDQLDILLWDDEMRDPA